MIKAEDLSLKKLLNASQERGEIYFKDRRMIISSADAWGLLRKDLISALGMERAKRFLLRYGWNCGVNDARILKNMFDWEDDIELMLAGPQMHIITGNVLSKALKVEVDREKGTFFFDGYWVNSFEAVQHMMQFGKHDESVCYTLLGYAGGYSSEYMGKRIIFKEVECVGRGDKYCRNVGKTVEEWGDEIAADLADYEEESLADELDNAYRRIEQQKEILKVGFRINQNLTQIVLQGKGLDTIAKTLGESLSCSVVIENQYFEKMTAFGVLSGTPLKTLIENAELNSERPGWMDRLLVYRRTIELDFPAGANGEHRLITPIILRNQIYGFVSLIKQGCGFDEMEKVSLERTAAVCSIQIFNEQTAIETEQRMKGELLDELLNRDVDPDEISKRLSYLGYSLADPQYVFVFQLENESQTMGKENEDNQLETRKKIVDLLSAQFETSGYRFLISAKLDRVYTLVPQKFIEKQRQTLKQYGEHLLGQIMGRSNHVKITLGISNIYRELKDFHKGYHEAMNAIEIARLKRKDQQVILSSELGHLGLLLNARHPDELESFAQGKLGGLYEYDQKNNGELMKTLYYYVENEYNLHKAAREMNISISGIRYRLLRIQELIQLELNVSSARFEVQLALEILLVLGKIKLQ